MSEQPNDSRHICKCIYGEKCPASEPPTPTDTNTSFKEELGQILDRYQFHFTHQFTHKEDPFTKDQALTSIINLVDKEVPPRVEDATNDSRVPYIGGWSEGYNQAVDDMRNKIRDGE